MMMKSRREAERERRGCDEARSSPPRCCCCPACTWSPGPHPPPPTDAQQSGVRVGCSWSRPPDEEGVPAPHTQRTRAEVMAPGTAASPPPPPPPPKHAKHTFHSAPSTPAGLPLCRVHSSTRLIWSDPGTRTRKHGGAGYGWHVDRGAWTAKTVKRPRQQPAQPQYANYWGPLTRKRHTTPHPAQPRHSPGTPTTGLRERGNDTSKSTGRSGRQKAATRRNMRREERVTVQGPVKKQQPDRMSHRGAGLGCALPFWRVVPTVPCSTTTEAHATPAGVPPVAPRAVPRQVLPLAQKRSLWGPAPEGQPPPPPKKNSAHWRAILRRAPSAEFP